MPIVLFWYLSVIIAFIQVRDIGDENFTGLHTCIGGDSQIVTQERGAKPDPI